MARVVVTAEVEDGARWEENFVTHRSLFDSMTNTVTCYSVSNNEIAVYSEMTDWDTWLEVFRSEATASAMAQDGVKRETVKMYRLDKQL